ncbi:MAG: hypothetical protein H0U73_04750 [Tatlockia sp.]|nr:hypothetical protein [Tatlockia sp.]
MADDPSKKPEPVPEPKNETDWQDLASKAYEKAKSVGSAIWEKGKDPLIDTPKSDLAKDDQQEGDEKDALRKLGQMGLEANKIGWEVQKNLYNMIKQSFNSSSKEKPDEQKSQSKDDDDDDEQKKKDQIKQASDNADMKPDSSGDTPTQTSGTATPPTSGGATSTDGGMPASGSADLTGGATAPSTSADATQETSATSPTPQFGDMTVGSEDPTEQSMDSAANDEPFEQVASQQNSQALDTEGLKEYAMENPEVLVM